jgi:hypothetical protein
MPRFNAHTKRYEPGTDLDAPSSSIHLIIDESNLEQPIVRAFHDHAVALSYAAARFEERTNDAKSHDAAQIKLTCCLGFLEHCE